jgi:hypothetical protein
LEVNGGLGFGWSTNWVPLHTLFTPTLDPSYDNTNSYGNHFLLDSSLDKSNQNPDPKTNLQKSNPKKHSYVSMKNLTHFRPGRKTHEGPWR